MCGEYMRRMQPAECLQRARPWLDGSVPAAAFATHAAWLANIVACYQERVALFSEFGGKLAWLFCDVPAMDEAAQKNLQKDPAAKEWLLGYADVLAASNAPPSWPQSRGSADSEVALPSKKDAQQPSCAFATPQQIEQECRAFTERIGVKFGNFVHPVRAALTGTDKGPGLFDVVFLLGKDACTKRLRAAAQS
jgi:glutamyl/glutaminyl-tRNA synthetase